MSKKGKSDDAAAAEGRSSDSPKTKSKDSKSKKKSTKQVDSAKEKEDVKEADSGKEGIISQCPDLLLQQILSHLEHTHLFRSQRVSTKWKLIVKQCLAKADWIKIRFSFPKSLDDDVFRHIATKKYDPTLITQVSLHSVPHISDKTLRHIAELLPSVTSVDLLHVCGISDKGLRSLGSLALTSLRVSHTPITDKGIRSFFERIGPSLTSLDLSHSAHIDTNDLAELLGTRAPALTRLNLTRCAALSDESIARLGSLPCLSELRLGWLKRLSDKGLLDLVSESNSVAPLRLLDLTGCPVNDEFMSLLPKKFPKLRTLKLAYCSGVKPSGLENIRLLKYLRVLHLEYTRLDDATLRTLDTLKHLRCLSIVGTDDLSEKAIAKFRSRSAAHVADYFLRKPK